MGSSEAETPLKVMSFNLRYGTAMDGENSWPHRQQTLLNAIKHYGPDIIGVQECLMFQVEFIEQALPEYHWFGVPREKNGVGEMSAILYRQDMFAPIEAGNFWLSETPDVPGSRSWETACTRMVTWARFRQVKTGAYFYFFNTHFDHQSQEARVQSAHLLLKRIASQAGDLPVILTGDFNANAEQAKPWSVLTEGGLKDAWLSAGEQKGPEQTFGQFGAPDENAEERRIDWILTRGPIAVSTCETGLYEEDGRYPSDHYPVIAEMMLR